MRARRHKPYGKWRRLDTFVAYISFRCGRGLLGQSPACTHLMPKLGRQDHLRQVFPAP